MKHKMNPILDAQLNRRRGFRGHKRNLSDPRFSTSLTDEYYTEDEVSQSVERIQGQLAHPVVKVGPPSLSFKFSTDSTFSWGRQKTSPNLCEVEMGLTEGSVVLLQFGYAPRPYSSLSREYDPICDPSLSAAYGMDNSR